MYNRWGSAVSTPSHFVSAIRWVVRDSTRWFKIDSNSRVQTDCEHPTIETLWVVRKSSTIVFEISYTWFILGPLDNPTFNHKSRSNFGWVKGSFLYLFFNRVLYLYRVHQTILSSTTNLDCILDGLEDCPRISPSTGCYMYLEKKNQIQKIITKLLKSNMPWILSSAIHELPHPFLTIIISHMYFYKKLHRSYLVSKNCSLRKKTVVSYTYLYTTKI
jgi:hypothetical protein